MFINANSTVMTYIILQTEVEHSTKILGKDKVYNNTFSFQRASSLGYLSPPWLIKGQPSNSHMNYELHEI